MFLDECKKTRGSSFRNVSGKGIWSVLTAFLLIFCFLPLLSLQALASQDAVRTVRVGFFALDNYHQEKEDGSKTGYGYDFLQMIAPYANFQYEYVGYDRNWSEMQQMLLDGEIDLVTSVKKTPEREKIFEFSRKSAGASYSMLTVHSDNAKYIIGDYSTLEGIRVGLLKGNGRNASFERYAEEHGFSYQPVYFDNQDEMQKAMSETNEIDAIVSSSIRILGENETVYDRFDREEYYIAVRKGDDELMERIDYAMDMLESSTPDWLVILDDKYQNNSGNGGELLLTTEEKRCIRELKDSGKTLKVLINPQLEPYSYFEDGVPKGILVDLLAMSAEKVGFSYEILETETTGEYMELIQSGGADLVFDAAFDYYTAEKAGYYLTSPYYTTTYARITRNNNNTGGTVAAIKSVGGLTGDRYLEPYIDENTLRCSSFEECVEAVRSGRADYAYTFTYTASLYVGRDYTNSIAHEVMKEISCPVAVAVRSDLGRTFYSIMDKMASNIGSEQRDAAISANTQYNVKGKELLYFVYNEPLIVIAIMVVVMTVIVLLILWFRMREKKAELCHRESDARQKEALQAAYEAADRANKAKSDFLSRMSHDIRTPLNSIIGMTAIATAHKNDTNRVSDCLAKITASGRHLLGLVNEVLDMSKLESGKVTLNEEAFNLSNLLENLLELVHPDIRARRHELAVRIHNIDHEDVWGDSLRIQQAFINIVSNAAKYTPDGGKIEIDISELPSKSPKIGVYQFVFRDNGIGMSPEYAKTIFDPFSRERDSRIDKIQGTGLGMAITKNIVQMMDGSIQVESEQGKGSTFTVIIRLKLQNTGDVQTEAFVGLPVLVVDDDRSICESTCMILDEIGMESEYVLSGREAVDKVAGNHAQEEDYFAVILDWKMPDMDGLETTKAIRRAVGPDVPIIILSAYDWADIEQEAKEAGVNAFVSKPLFKSKLLYTFGALTNKEEKPEEDKNTEEENQLECLEQLDFSGKRLLLVEDNKLNREIACEIIGMTKIQIDTAEDGEAAVQRFEESEYHYYDLILMDVQMPVMNGYDATMAIRAMNRPDAKSVPIVAMTANAFAEDVEKALASQMNEHLAKPLDIQKLAEVLSRWLQS